MKIVKAADITCFSFPVSETIHEKYILKFIRTNFLKEGIELLSDQYFIYNFIDSSSTYEVFLFQSDSIDDLSLEPFIFDSYYEEFISGIDLFITDKFFSLYKDGKPFTFKTIQNVSNEDIELYISQTYNIKIDRIIEVDEAAFDSLKTKTKKETTFYRAKEDNSFRFFQIFLILSFIVSGFILNCKINSLNEKEQSSVSVPSKILNCQNKLLKAKKVYKKHDRNVVVNIVEVFKYLAIHNISVAYFEYNDKRSKLKLIHTNKQNLLDFLTTYQKDMEVSSINFNKQLNKYEMVVTIEN